MAEGGGNERADDGEARGRKGYLPHASNPVGTDQTDDERPHDDMRGPRDRGPWWLHSVR